MTFARERRGQRRAQAAQPPQHLVMLTTATGPRRQVELHLIGQAELSGGVGGWEVVDRPKRRGVPEWAGVAPYQLVLPLLADGMDIRPGVDVSVEPTLRQLEEMGSPIGVDRDPPVLRLSGPVSLPQSLGGLRWVLTDIAWGAEVRDDDTRRIQAQVTVTLLQFVAATAVLSPAAAARAKQTTPAPDAPAASRTYVVKSGDTLSKIAAQQLGDFRRFAEIASLNGLRDPNFIKAGQTLKLP